MIKPRPCCLAKIPRIHHLFIPHCVNFKQIWEAWFCTALSSHAESPTIFTIMEQPAAELIVLDSSSADADNILNKIWTHLFFNGLLIYLFQWWLQIRD